MWKGGGAIEVCVVFQNIKIVERCEGEVEVEKDTMGTVVGVKEVNVFGVIGNGLNYQIPIRWKVDSGEVVFAKKLKTRKGLMLLLLTFYLIWIVDFRACISTPCSIGHLTLEAENTQEEKEDECTHHLRLQRMQCKVKSPREIEYMRRFIFSKLIIIRYLIGGGRRPRINK